MARAKKRTFADETPPELRWPLGPLPTGVLLFALAFFTLLALAFPDGALSSFRELRLPDANIRLLDRRMHVKALNEAGRKLNELLHRAGRRNFQ